VNIVRRSAIIVDERKQHTKTKTKTKTKKTIREIVNNPEDLLAYLESFVVSIAKNEAVQHKNIQLQNTLCTASQIGSREGWNKTTKTTKTKKSKQQSW